MAMLYLFWCQHALNAGTCRQAGQGSSQVLSIIAASKASGDAAAAAGAAAVEARASKASRRTARTSARCDRPAVSPQAAGVGPQGRGAPAACRSAATRFQTVLTVCCYVQWTWFGSLGRACMGPAQAAGRPGRRLRHASSKSVKGIQRQRAPQQHVFAKSWVNCRHTSGTAQSKRLPCH